MRCAMRVYGAAGRRRDIVELYSGHMHHLREQVNGVPSRDAASVRALGGGQA